MAAFAGATFTLGEKHITVPAPTLVVIAAISKAPQPPEVMLCLQCEVVCVRPRYRGDEPALVCTCCTFAPGDLLFNMGRAHRRPNDAGPHATIPREQLRAAIDAMRAA